MKDQKMYELREEVINGLENTLSELYKKLPPLPDDFEEIAGTMDDDDVIGNPEGPDLLNYHPETYRWLTQGESKTGGAQLCVFWFDNPFVPSDQVSLIKEHELAYVIEIRHEYGEFAVYKEKDDWQVISKLLPEINNAGVNTTEGQAGINLLQTVWNNLIELL